MTTDIILASGNIADLYEPIVHVQAGHGSKKKYLGDRHQCQFCGESNPRKFRTDAHLFPAALGNKWIFSLAECDSCNQLFSSYEDALTKAISPLLVVGGVPGRKQKQSRQIGRSGSGSLILHQRGENGRELHFRSQLGEDASVVGIRPFTGELILHVPVPLYPFIPRSAYKALTRMAYALLPASERPHYEMTRAWLQQPDDAEPFHLLEVGLSFGSIGNSPPIVAGTLFRRRDNTLAVSHMIFVFVCGSACFQIELLPDSLDDHLPPVPMGKTSIEYAAELGPSADSHRIQYGKPVSLNWASRVGQPQSFASLELALNPTTGMGTLTPILRASA